MNKKYLIGLAVLFALVGSGAAINIEDATIEPVNPEDNDSVNITAYVDGEGTDINSVDVNVYRDSNIIVEDHYFDMVNGREEELSSWGDAEVFTVDLNDSEKVTYDMRIQAIDESGNNDEYILTAVIDGNETEIIEDDLEEDNKLFGIGLAEIIGGVFIVSIFYIVVFG